MKFSSLLFTVLLLSSCTSDTNYRGCSFGVKYRVLRGFYKGCYGKAYGIDARGFIQLDDVICPQDTNTRLSLAASCFSMEPVK